MSQPSSKRRAVFCPVPHGLDDDLYYRSREALQLGALAIDPRLDEGMLQSVIMAELRVPAERGAEVRHEACGT